MEIKCVPEFEIDLKTSAAINKLLQVSFPDIDYQQRDYFKQLQHSRLLAREDGKLLGQLGMDYRVMRLGENPFRILGIVDFCVHPDYRGKGIGKALMREFEAVATRVPGRVDFLFLVTDSPEYYKALGYSASRLTTTWLRIHKHRNYGVTKEFITDASFMFKPVSDKEWNGNELDLLGFMY